MTTVDVITSRRTHMFVDPGLFDNVRRFRENLYTSMLIDDIGMMILPTFRNENFSVTWSGTNTDAIDLISNALSSRRYNSGLKDSVYDFFRQCAQTIMAYGKSHYETVYFKKESDDQWTSFELAHIVPYSIFNQGGSFYQKIPIEDDIHGDKLRKVLIPNEYILTFNLPRMLQKHYELMMDTLYNIKTVPPDFSLPYNNPEQIPFDFTNYLLYENLAIACAVRNIGWNARNLFDKNVLDYYLIYRMLLFKKFLILLRNEILSTLNSGINSIGDKIGFSGDIQLNGIMTLEDLNDLTSRLESGDISFLEIIEILYK